MLLKRTGSVYSDQNWLRSFLFTIYGTSVLVVSYFPLFYSHLGFSSSQVGYLYALGPSISILSNLFWSMISDRLGTVRKIMFILLIGQLITGLLLARATEFSSVMLILSFFYFFYYPVFPLADTMAIKVAERHGRSFITIRVFGSVGYSFFALTIGYALRALGPTWSLTLCLIIVIIALLITLGLKDVKKTADQQADIDDITIESDQNKQGLKDILLQKEVLWFFGCVFFLALGYRMNEAFLTITLKRLGAGEEIIGWALLTSALSEIPVLFILSKYGEKFKELPLLAFASIIFALRFILMSQVDHPNAIIAIQSMHSLSFGVFFVTSIRYITRIIPDRLRATGLAVYTVVWSSASGLISGTFGGMIYQEAGRSPFYIVAVGFSLIAFVGFLGQHLLDLRRQPLQYSKARNKKASL